MQNPGKMHEGVASRADGSGIAGSLVLGWLNPEACYLLDPSTLQAVSEAVVAHAHGCHDRHLSLQPEQV